MRILQVMLVIASVCAPGVALAQRVPDPGPDSGSAGRAPVVVELFTSQGCSSCPPADALLAGLAARDDVIALALHVDYWDYLGWVDTFGSPAHTMRQRAYAKVARERSLYTPQVVVQGVDRAIGSDERVHDLVEQHLETPEGADLAISREGDVLDVRLKPRDPAGAGPCDVFLVRFISGGKVFIGGGENAGHEIDYANVVTEWIRLARWDGRTEAEFSMTVAGDAGIAVIVQRERMGPVLTAAVLP